MDAVLLLLAGMGGGVLGAFLGGRAVAAAAGRQVARNQAAREARLLINFFQALEAELSQSWERYQHLLGQHLEKAEDLEDLPLAAGVPAGESFAVYCTSARLLGALDPASATELITAYVHFQGLLQEWQTLWRLAEEHRRLRLQADLNLYELRNLRAEIQRYLDYLKKRHLQVKALVVAALERLREFLELSHKTRDRVAIRL